MEQLTNNEWINRDPRFTGYFLANLAENETRLLQLIQAADEAANGYLPMNREEGKDVDTRRVLGKLWKDSYVVWTTSKYPGVLSSDDDTEDPIELEDEKDLREEQDGGGRYYVVRDGELVYASIE
jgi:hypothetical protein